MMMDTKNYGGGNSDRTLAVESHQTVAQGAGLLQFNSNTDINQQFRFLATIGKGAYGSVLLVESALCDTNEIYAIKVLKYMDNYKTKAEKEEHMKNLTQELQIMESLQGSPFIVKLYGNIY